THVTINSGKSKKAGTAINQSFEVVGVKVLFTHQIDQHTGIEIAASRAHDHAAARGQPHAGVHRSTAFDRGDADAVTEMRNDEPVGWMVPELAHDRFAGKAMKSIA